MSDEADLRARIAALESEREELLRENQSLQAMAGVGGDEGVDLDAIERMLEPVLGSQKIISDGCIGLLDSEGRQVTAVKPAITGLRRLVIGGHERAASAIEAVMDAAEYASVLINAVKAARLKATHYANGMHLMSDMAQRAQEKLDAALAEIERLRNQGPDIAKAGDE